MKTVRDHLIFLSLLCCLFSFTYSLSPFFSFSACILIWYFRTEDSSWAIVFLIFLLLSVPRMTSGTFHASTARIIQVKNNYAVIRKGFHKALIYTDGPAPFDTDIHLSAEGETILAAHGFYRYSFAEKMRAEGITTAYGRESWNIEKEHFSFRRLVQKRIESIADTRQRALLYRLLLGITVSDAPEDTLLFAEGFSVTCLLSFFGYILKYLCRKDRRNRILIGLNILLALFLHFPMILTFSLISRICTQASLSKTEKTAVPVILTLFLFPSAVMTPSFLIILIYRLSRYSYENRSENAFFLQMHVQSIFMHYADPVFTVMFPFLRILAGAACFTAWIDLFFPFLHLTAWTGVLNRMMAMLSVFRVRGSCLGSGTFFYLLMLLSVRKYRHKTTIRIILFLVFLRCGLFHPFPSVTFINVGQGDAVFISSGLHRDTVLIDTGKPSQEKNLQSFLDAVSVNRLSLFVITHPDSDHSGNAEFVREHYHPEKEITEHEKVIRLRSLTFYDLNEIKNSDENQSSIVLLTRMNQLNYLFMADADEQSERAVIRNYDALECDILKLSHHGSKTGSCERFLDTVKPEIGIISSGSYSIYHHPSPEVIQRLLKRHIPYFDTKEEGDIVILSIWKWNFLITSKGTISILKPS